MVMQVCWEEIFTKENKMQSFDFNDEPISKIVPLYSLEDLKTELKKPNVEYVKVFLVDDKMKFKHQSTFNELLIEGEAFDEPSVVSKQLHGKALRKSLRQK